MYFGSDDEKALTKSIEDAFPSDDYVQSILKTTLTTTCRIKWRYTRRNDSV